jgi:hypothetical protein
MLSRERAPPCYSSIGKLLRPGEQVASQRFVTVERATVSANFAGPRHCLCCQTRPSTVTET